MRSASRRSGCFAALIIFVILQPFRGAAQDFGPVASQSRPSPVAPDYARSPLLGHLWHWRRFPLRVFLATHDTAENQAARVALAGFDEWVEATQSAIRYTIVDNPARADISVRFVASESLPGQPGVAGETRVSSRQGTILEASMVLAMGNVTPADFESVAAHEFGHALGIGGHSDDPNDLMYPVETRYISATGVLPGPSHPVTLRDLNTLRLCYPRLF